MTIQETGIIMDLLSAVYPRFGAGGPGKEKTLAVWADVFEDDDVNFVAAAVKAYICTDEKGFPPHPGAIKTAMHRLSRRGEPDETEAWAMVRKAVRNSCYESVKEFAALPEDLRKIVGSASQLRDWALMDSDVVNSVVASNFQRAYRTRQECQHREAMLPSGIRKALAGVSERMALGDGT